MVEGKNSDPATVVIFGASGDLTESKLVPALFALHRQGRLPEAVRILGFARRPLSDDDFRDRLRKGAADSPEIQFEAGAWVQFARRIHYLQGDGRGRQQRECEGGAQGTPPAVRIAKPAFHGDPPPEGPRH